MIAPGDLAPDFNGPTSQDTPFRLSAQRGHPVVLYFYPKADTPGCTVESKGFRDHLGELDARQVTVVGVSVDTIDDQKAFARKYGLNFPLVADSSGEIANRYGVLGSRGSARRVTFLIDAAGRVEKVVDSSVPGNHVAAACAADWGRK